MKALIDILDCTDAKAFMMDGDLMIRNSEGVTGRQIALLEKQLNAEVRLTEDSVLIAEDVATEETSVELDEERPGRAYVKERVPDETGY